MQGLRVVSRDGSAVGQDEIDAAHRVVATFGGRTFGTPSATDDATGVRVEYHAHKNMAIVEPAGVDYRLVSFPSPWPGKKLSVHGVLDNGFGSPYYEATAIVCLDDGETIATFPYDTRDERLINGWDGSTSIQFYDSNLYDPGRPFGYVPTRAVTFAVPADCVYSNGEDQVPNILSQAGWTDAQLSEFCSRMLDRRSTWSEAMTRDTMAFDFAGEPDLWPKWDAVVKGNHPASIKLQRVFGPTDIPLIEEVIETVVSDDATTDSTSGIWAKNVRTTQKKRDVSLRFKLTDSAGAVSDVVETHSGTWTSTTTEYQAAWKEVSDPTEDLFSSVFYSNVYDNWYTKHSEAAIDQDTPQTSGPILSDMHAHAAGSLPNTPGTLWTGSESYSDRSPAAYCFSQGFANPPIVSSNDITWAAPAIIAEYLRLLTIRKSSLAGFDNRYPGPQPESFHLFTAAASVRRVDAILFGAVRSGRSLGMYWQRDWDVDPADHLIDGVDIYGILRMRWDTARGRLVVVGMTPVQSPNPSDPPGTPARVMFTAPVPHLGANAILRFSGLKHLDMRARAKTLRGYLREDPPAHASEVAELLGTNWSANPERDAVQTIVAGILAAIGDL
ncbi:MAG: hypothetical protein V5B60_18725 [Accumulibacter sp.]|jgi:hypothetical protein|uniref:hypothetical protein n=1 Tax=Accumulibacter sp. TaxID=2053492 RepID=UPI002FC2E011